MNENKLEDKERETLHKKLDAEVSLITDYMKFMFSLFLLSSGGTGALVVQDKAAVFIYFGVAISLFLLIIVAIFTLARLEKIKKY